MKTILLSSALVLFSMTALAKNVELNLVQEDSVPYLKNGSQEIFLGSNVRVENAVFVVELSNSNQTFTLANVDLDNSSSDISISKEKIKANILVNKKNRDFKTQLCSHMGCIPFPHFETTEIQLIEVETLEGNTLCFSRNITKHKPWSLGKCQKV